MKTVKKTMGIIALGMIIGLWLSSCISIAPAPEPTAEELAFRSKMENATWNVERLNSPPSLNGFISIKKPMYTEAEWEISTEFSYFRRAAGDGEDYRGRTLKVLERNSERTITLIGLDDNTWYRLTAPELPGRTYLYNLQKEGVLGTYNIYKKMD